MTTEPSGENKKNFFDQIQTDIATARFGVEERQAAEQERLLSAERAALDTSEGTPLVRATHISEDEHRELVAPLRTRRIGETEHLELLEKRADQLRARTLDLSWALPKLLEGTGAIPHAWKTPAQREDRGALNDISLRYDPVFVNDPDAEAHTPARKRKGIFKKIDNTDRYTHIEDETVVEGWPLLQWKYQDFKHNPLYTVALVPASDPHSESDYNLVYFAQYEQPGSGGSEYIPLKPEDVHSLPRKPLSEDDMPWPREWPADGVVKSTQDESFVFIPSKRMGEVTPDYDTYYTAGIEQRLYQALIDLAAEHNVLPIRTQLEMEKIRQQRTAAAE